MNTKTRRITIVVFFLLCSICSIIFCLWLFKDQLGIAKISSATLTAHSPQPQRYALLKEDLKIRKSRLAQRYEVASTQNQRNAVLAESRELLEAVLPEMMRCWLGTKWDYHGMTEQPGDGKIACGYYVSTVMRDAGFNLHRIRLAQQPSQTILKAFVPRSSMHIHTGMAYADFCEKVKSLDKGIYIVGLDQHVGFIVHDGSQLHFIHSSGGAPQCVVDESEHNAQSLQDSTYRVVGNITAQTPTLLNWLNAKRIYP